MSEIAQQLKERTPYEYFSQDHPIMWEHVKRRASRLFSNSSHFPNSYKKFKLFVKKYNHRDLFKKQLNDPHILSRGVSSILNQVTDKVTMLPGNMTKILIDEWLLQNVFNQGEVDRDYRKYALRGYVNAVSSKEHISHVAQINKYIRQTQRVRLPHPHVDYLNQVQTKINTLIVSHKQRDKLYTTRSFTHQLGKERITQHSYSIRGHLHKETLFGLRTPPNAIQGLHLRRSLKSLKLIAQIEKIVDPVIKDLVKKAFLNYWNGEPYIPSDAFFQEFSDGSNEPKVWLPNKNGEKVPVRKVRMREALTTGVRLKKQVNQYVIPRNNHHILLFKDKEEKIHEEVVTFWEAVNRFRNKQPIYTPITPEKGEFICSIKLNNLFLLGLQNVEDNLALESASHLNKHLYRVRKISSKYYEFRLANRIGNFGTEYPEFVRISNFGDKKTGWKTFNPIKVKVSITGVIERIK